MLENEKLAWAAGFFDADGSIGISPPRKKALYVLALHVTQVVPEPLRIFQHLFAGKVNVRPQRGNSRPSWVWTAEARVAEHALRAMLPWLVVRRERAELALAFRKLFARPNIVPRGPGLRHPDADVKRARIMAERETIYRQMRELNRRGVN